MFLAKDFFECVAENKRYSKLFVEYYKRLYNELDNDLYLRKSINLDDCNSYYYLDVYEKSKLKDVKKINLCKDKFCCNCKKVKQSVALGRYFDILNNQSNLYHLVLTVPNCNGSDLKSVVHKMSKKFYYLVRYLRNDVKIHGLDLSFIGFKGAIRSLEVTYIGDSYHPHYHCLISCDCLNLNKNIKNTFGFSYGVFKRYFSDFEVYIQKIWYLLLNDIKVTKVNIDNLDIGYSSILDEVDSTSIYEIFKYIVKSTDDDGQLCTYDNFKALYFALYRVKQVQGYGIFYNMDFDDYELQINDLYESYILDLQKKELPSSLCDKLGNCIADSDFLYFSKFSLFRYYNTLKDKNV